MVPNFVPQFLLKTALFRLFSSRFILELGTFLRQRYGSLFPSDAYRRKDLYVRSTDRDRTIESAVANLGTFYNVTEAGYVPFPAHSVPVDFDNLLRYPNLRCKKYANLKSELVQTAKMEELNEKYKPDLKRMAELVNSSLTYRIENMWQILDTIDCHIANNKTGNFKKYFNILHKT